MIPNPWDAGSARVLAGLGFKALVSYLASGRPDEGVLVFPIKDGQPWSDHHWRNWRKRRFTAAALAEGLESLRPYDLRHSFVSLLLAEGASVLEVAQQAGHSPTMALNTYGHVIEEWPGRRGSPRKKLSARP